MQWCAFDFDNPIAPEGSPYLRTGEIFKIARGGHSNAWVPHLGDIFRFSGMNAVESVSEVPRKEMLRYWRNNWYIGVGNLVRVVNNIEVDEIWALCEKERAEKGMKATWPTVMANGKRP